MVELGTLSDTELEEQAKRWREEALRGSREARGIAHACEVELRRRLGPTQPPDPRNLDLRPLSEREPPVRRWSWRSD